MTALVMNFGSDDCLKVSGCVAQCDNEACAQGCAKAGSAAGADLYGKVVQCTVTNKDVCKAP